MCEIVRPNKDFWFACVDIDVICDEKLSQTAKNVFAILCSFTSVNNRSCYPSIKAIAERVGLCDRSVQNALNELIGRGVIKKVLRKNQNGYSSSLFIIIGHNAECYKSHEKVSEQNSQGGESECTSLVNHVAHRKKQENDIIYSNEGAEAPSSENHEIEQVPEIMRPTARYLLQRTGRKKLTDREISALKQLSESQVPARVQKEIDKAYDRYLRHNWDLKDLNFEYIARSLAYQPTFGKNKKIGKADLKKIQDEAKEFDAAIFAGADINDDVFMSLLAEINEGGSLAWV